RPVRPGRGGAVLLPAPPGRAAAARLHRRPLGRPPGRLRPRAGDRAGRHRRRALLPEPGARDLPRVRLPAGVWAAPRAPDLGGPEARRPGARGLRRAGEHRMTAHNGLEPPAPPSPQWVGEGGWGGGREVPNISLADAPARERAERDLDTSFLVEAPAGSGKTTLLVARILAWVESGRARLPEIVAITFTEKAAADLRLRLREAIERARPGADSAQRRRLDEALAGLELAPIP